MDKIKGIEFSVEADNSKLASGLKTSEKMMKKSAKQMGNQKVIVGGIAGTFAKVTGTMGSVEGGAKAISGVFKGLRGDTEGMLKAFESLPAGIGPAISAVRGLWNEISGAAAREEARLKRIQNIAKEIKLEKSIAAGLQSLADMEFNIELFNASEEKRKILEVEHAASKTMLRLKQLQNSLKKDRDSLAEVKEENLYLQIKSGEGSFAERIQMYRELDKKIAKIRKTTNEKAQDEEERTKKLAHDLDKKRLGELSNLKKNKNLSVGILGNLKEKLHLTQELQSQLTVPSMSTEEKQLKEATVTNDLLAQIVDKFSVGLKEGVGGRF